MRRKWLPTLGAAVGLWAGAAQAEEAVWRPAPAPPPAAAAIASTPARPPAAALGRPVAATLGRPVPAAVAPAPVVDPRLSPVSYRPASDPLGPVFRGQAPDPPPPGVPAAVPPPTGLAPVQPPPDDPLLSPGAPPPPLPPGGQPGLLGGWLGCTEGCGRRLFQSDHGFDDFASPVTNPFLFEDPRALTEVRPIFIWQQTPRGNPIFHGGDTEFFGIQARVAITERLSFTMQKLGWVWMEPHNATNGFEPHGGFSEINLGAKYTFLRNERTGTLGAAGLTFEIPSGPRQVYQDTGTLSLRPYVTMGQRFGQSSFGTFHALGTFGGSFATDNKRSDYVFGSLHLDYDVANLHKIYPLVELNWYHYTKSGNSNALNFEGTDLFNFGSTNVAGQDLLTIAVGARYKFTEWLQTGLAAEWPVTGRKELTDFRLTADLIFRY
ncbi:MAG TPA: hypothetical protein VFA26_08860 [Gemmataceae bacterium]|nr:hypothetical protein [Gemmataceae bacterium]